MIKVLILAFVLISGCASKQTSQTSQTPGGSRGVASSAVDELPSKAVCVSDAERVEIDFRANTILAIHDGQRTAYGSSNSWMLRETSGRIHINHSGPHAKPYLIADIDPTATGFSGEVGALMYPGPVPGRCKLQP